MNIKSYFKIILFPTKNNFFDFEPITGEIELDIYKKISIISLKLSLILNENWEYNGEKDSNYEIIYTNDIKLNDILNINKNNIDEYDLDSNMYLIPFSFPVLINLQPSFEDYKIFLRYYLKYEIKYRINNTIGVHQDNIFILIKNGPKLKLDSNLSFSSSTTLNKWGIMNKGISKIDASYPKNCYELDDNVPLEITIDNTQSELKFKKIQLTLFRNYTLFKNIKNKTYTISKKIHSIKEDINIIKEKKKKK